MTNDNNELVERLNAQLRGYQTYSPDAFEQPLHDVLPYLNKAGTVVNFKSIWLRDPRDDWTHYFTHALVSDSTAKSLCDSDYTGTLILTWSIPVEKLSCWISEILQNGFSPPNSQLPPVDLKRQVGFGYEKLRDPNSHLRPGVERPVLEIHLQPEKNPKLPMTAYYPISNRSKPTCRNATDLIRLEQRYYGWQNNYSWCYGILIECRDTRGRIEDIHRRSPIDSCFEVVLSSNRNSTNSRVTCVVDSDRDSLALECQYSKGGTWEFTLPEGAQSLSLIAIDDLGLVLDIVNSISVNDIWPRFVQRIHSSEIESAIRSGENDTTEFKSWRILSATKKAKGTILKAVVAFANSKGGRLVIGISDDHALDGPHTNSRPDGSMQLEDNTVEALRQVRSWIQEEIRPSVSVLIDVLPCNNRTVIVIDVKQSESKPCCARNDVYYIREGASSRPGMQSDLILLFRQS